MGNIPGVCIYIYTHIIYIDIYVGGYMYVRIGTCRV